MCPLSSVQRELLKSKMLVAHIVVPAPLEGGCTDSAWTSAARDVDGDPSGSGDSPLETYWHIGGMRFSPYSAAFRPLRFLEQRMHNDVLEHHLEALVA